MIAVVDYGMGNLRSVEKALEACGAKAAVTSSPDVLSRADKVVFPGVGSFPKCMERLRELELVECLKNAAGNKPFLGICLGLQALFSYGYVGGRTGGLDIIKGNVVRFTEGVKIPHMGWNQVSFRKKCEIFRGIPESSYFYFVHSYYVVPDNNDIIAGMTDYAGMFVSAIERDNIIGVQFHPEKSQGSGLKVLENFIKL
jgi:glutamine amidotransferase